ncbi:glycosyltransferase [Phaeodactylibacter xiamenensis]|uniref:glycosyltransferase n=1 Tax=Phaeodactylibacter xiamenensis TaxID=1524460 RepID=UPI0024A9E74A|nr:glycosyltransferase [Phaeodactylibacter xiamenensis]
MNNHINCSDVSFIIITYNQERFIESAILSAINQTKSPKEIIVVDDCSTDNTYEVASRVISNYKARIKILLHKNAKNLGIVGNFFMGAQLSSGEWITGCAGDDVAKEDKVDILIKNLSQHKNSPIYAVGNAVQVINENGIELTKRYYDLNAIPQFKSHFIHGSAFAYHRSCFENFPKIDKMIQTEDLILPFRALLLGGILITNEISTKYRISNSNISSNYGGSHKVTIKKMISLKENNILSYSQRKIDVNSTTLDDFTKLKLTNLIEKDIADSYQELNELHKISNFYKKKSCTSLFGLLSIKVNPNRAKNVKVIIKVLLNSVKIPEYIYIKALKNRINHRSHFLNTPIESVSSRVLTLKDYVK